MGEVQPQTIEDVYYAQDVAGQTDTGKGEPMESADMKTDEFVQDLNRSGSWQAQDGDYPVPVKDDQPDTVDKSELQKAIRYAESIDLSLYTDATADAVRTALDTARQVNDDAEATQQQVNEAQQALMKAIAGLEEGIIEPSTIIRDLGRYTYWSTPQPMCWIYRQGGGTHGPVNVTRAIEVSCNYFMYDVGRRLGIDKLDEYAAMFGLGQKTGVELYEESGVVASPAFTESLGGTWYEGNVLSVAIGQESTQVTPIQLTNYISTLVNGGTRYSTHLLKTVKSSDFSQVIYEYEPQVQDEINIAQENLEAVTEGMRELTTGDGSLASAFRNLPFEVGAKTGSAQVSSTSDSNAVFVCYAPYDDPEIAISLVVEHGGSGSVLASLAAEILAYYFTTPDSQSDVVTENTLMP